MAATMQAAPKNDEPSSRARPAVQGDLSPEEAFQAKLMSHLKGALTSNLIALGDSLGIYEAMKTHGKASSEELATAAGLHERFVREWLYQQVCRTCHCTSFQGPVTTFHRSCCLRRSSVRADATCTRNFV